MQKEAKLSRAKFLWNCYGCKFNQKPEGMFHFLYFSFLQQLVLKMLRCGYLYMQCAFGNIKFEDILKMGRMKDGMICDVKTGGCGDINFVHHTISRCPPIFTIGNFWRWFCSYLLTSLLWNDKTVLLFLWVFNISVGMGEEWNWKRYIWNNKGIGLGDRYQQGIRRLRRIKH